MLRNPFNNFCFLRGFCKLSQTFILDRIGFDSVQYEIVGSLTPEMGIEIHFGLVVIYNNI